MASTILNISSSQRLLFIQKDATTDYGIQIVPADAISRVDLVGSSFRNIDIVFKDGTKQRIDLLLCNNSSYNAGTATAVNNFMTDLKAMFTPGARDKSLGVAAKTADYTVSTSDDIIEVTTGAADKTMTLPAAASMTGRSLTFVKVDSGAGKIVLDGNASETINGATTNNEIDTQYDSLTIYSNGTAWYITVKRLA